MSPTPQTPPTDRPLTAGDVRYVEGHLDMTHAPSLGAFIGKSLASHVSGNRMPAMSGDNRERIPAHIRERFDRDCESTAKYILDRLYRADRVRILEVLMDESNAPDLNGVVNSDATTSCTSASRLTTAIIAALSARPATSAASEVVEGWLSDAMDAALHKRDFNLTEASDAILAALASPPVSERERELEGEVVRLREAGLAIYTYANDTLSGRVDGPDDRAWQRACVVEVRNRARTFLTAQPAGEGK